MSLDPVLIAYTARRTNEGGTAWARIGKAYPHERGSGLTVKLDAVPIDGVVILLELYDRDHARLAAEAARIAKLPKIAPSKARGSPAERQSKSDGGSAPSLNEIRAAQRLLSNRDRYTLTDEELAALKATVTSHERHAKLRREDLAVLRRLLLGLRKSLE